MNDLEGMRICVVAGTLGRGGAEQQLFYMLEAMCASGADPEVLSLTRGEYWESRIRGLGVPVRWVGRSESRLRRLAEIVRAVSARKPDIVQSQHFYTNLYVVGAARALDLHEICAIRNDVFSEVAAHGRLLGRMSLKAPRSIAANSRAAIRNAIGFGVPSTRLLFIPNVVDSERFSPAPPAARPTVTLVAAGRMKRAKRFDRFLHLVARLRAEPTGADVRAILVGDGPEAANLRRLASDLALTPDVLELPGTVDDMPSAYRRSDVFVLTSDWEGTPNVILEAMASGLPVVANGVGGVGDVVEDGETGFVVAAGDDDAMARAAARLVTDAAMRRAMGKRARHAVETSFAVHRLPSFLCEAYQAVLA